MSEKIVTIDVSASVGGNSLNVHGADIVLGVNDIPRIVLMVAPSKESATPLNPHVSKSSFNDFAGLYRDLCKKASGLNTKGSVEVTVKTDGITGMHYGGSSNIYLKDWVLTGVGMSGMTATSAPYMSVILQHPICNLTKAGSIYEEPNGNLARAVSKAVSGAGSFLKIVDTVFGVVSGGNNMFFKTLGSDMPKVFRESLGEERYRPSKYLEDKSGGLFLAKALKGAEDKLAAAIGRMVFPKDDGSSVWDMLLAASGALLLSIVQDRSNNYMEGEKLVLEPYKPWKTSDMMILDAEDCFQVDIPGNDNFKLIGVMTRKPSNFYDQFTMGMLKNGNGDQTNTISDILYVPSSVSPKSSDGRIMKTDVPPVLAQTVWEDAAEGGTIASTSINMSKARAGGLAEALMKYCQAVYEISAGAMNASRARMALSFHDRYESPLLPGNTCKFMAGGSAIFHGYIHHIVHHLSTSDGCFTDVSMSHVRSGEAYEVDGETAIPDGNKNAAYD